MHGRNRYKLLELHESHQEYHIFLCECDTLPGSTSEERPWGCWGPCPPVFPILLGTAPGCGYCTGAGRVRRIGLGFVRVHISYAPATPLMFLAGGWRSIDHRVTPQANLVFVTVPSPRIETTFPSRNRQETVDGTNVLRVMGSL